MRLSKNLAPLAMAMTVCCGLLAAQEQGKSDARLDPQMQAVLDELAKLGGKPIEKLTPDEARRQPTPVDAVKAVLKNQNKSVEPEAVGKVLELSIPGQGAPIPARSYAPKGEGPFPVLAYWHGGGWVLADLDTYDASCRALCNAANCLVVSCHYRQAPEHPFPAAADDAFLAYKWILANAERMNGDPRRVAVAGESAGGNLAAVVALRARDDNVQLPVHQLLVYPVTNYAFDTPSYLEHAHAKPLNRPMMQWFWGHYVAKPATGANPYASPLRAQRHDKLPPATIITADVDPLRSEGKAYADKLSAAGVPVEYVNYQGVTHEFFGMGAVVDKAKQAVAKTAEGLQAGFKK